MSNFDNVDAQSEPATTGGILSNGIEFPAANDTEAKKRNDR